MKKIYYPFAAVALVSLGANQNVSAQSAVDAMQVSQSDFKGTARYMGMGGAFTALGGDLSSIGLNPAGIGIYRSSEIGATLDIDFQKTSTSFNNNIDNKQTKAYCNNFGYVGTARLGGALQTFSWGVTYNRAVSFDRVTRGYGYPINTSLTNYIASFTNGINSADMDFDKGYNPYVNSDIDWLSILGYSSYMINNVNSSASQYAGLFKDGTDSDMEMSVEEKGYVDNYEFTFGGNFSNVVYWGLGIGINDLRYVRNTYYSESMANARIYSEVTPSGTADGSAEYYLNNSKVINGTGWNLSFGLIFKPVQAVRLGVSIQSPTWYSLDQWYLGSVDFTYAAANNNGTSVSGSEETDDAYFSWRLRSPWRFNVGAALVLGSSAIVSVDYERLAYNDMTIKTPQYDTWGYVNGFQDSPYLNDDIKKYTRAANSIRIGLEYRITPEFSARLGFNTCMSNIASEYEDGKGEILTSGTDPSFSLDKTTTYVSAGLGYRVGSFYIDGTYVHKTRKSTLHPFTSYANVDAPYFDVTDNNNSAVLTVGFKF